MAENGHIGIKGKIAAACVLCAVSLASATGIETTAEAKTGVWLESFAAATNLSLQTKAPLVLFWANYGCDHCQELEKAVGSAEFQSWQERHRDYVYCFVQGAGGNDRGVNADSGAKRFAATAGGTAKLLSSYPFVCLYWQKHDGTLAAKRIVGRAGNLDKDTFIAGGSLAAEFAACIEKYFAEYMPMPDYTGGDLAFTAEYDNARLEAEVGHTTFVEIPIARDSRAAGFVGTNTVKCVYAGETILNRAIVWAAKQATISIAVPIPSNAAAGDSIAVSLYDAAGEPRGTVNVFLIAPKENSPKNPLFIGERTAETLNYGEWTMDLDVAMAKYRGDAESKLLALVGGSLWCPDCVMMDAHLLERSEFKDWAKANKVILVDIDIPNFPNTTNSPSLLTRIAAKVSDSYLSGRGTIAPDEAQRWQSGAGYLSRHMVSDADAAKVFARNQSLAGRNTLNGGWNSPDRSNQNRMGVPTLIALRRDGTLAGRIDAFSAVAPSEFKAAYLNRLAELLATADDETDAGEDSNASWQTTTASYTGTGTSAEETLSAVDLVDTYRLPSVSSGAQNQTITVRGAAGGVTATVNLIQVTQGAPVTLASATGLLSDGITVDGVIASGADYYLQVCGEASGALALDSGSSITKAAYALSGSRTAIANPYSNDWISKTAAAVLPLYGMAGDGVSLLGTLELSLKKNRSLTAKYSDGKKALASFSGKWNSDEIAADGTVTIDLEKKGYTLSLTLKADGTAMAQVSSGTRTLSSGECTLAQTYADFAGYYTILLPALDASLIDSVPAGCSFMTMKMETSSAQKSGKFSYIVYLADGSKLSGTTGVTWLDANFGVVPVLKTSGNNTVAIAIKVRKDAVNAPSPRAIVLADGVSAWWASSKSGQAFTLRLGAYGSFYDKKRSLVEQSGVESLAWLPDCSLLSADSLSYGAFERIAGDGAMLKVTARKIAVATAVKGFSLSFNRSTGFFKGKTSLTFERKSNVPATYTGVVLPGWFSDCDCGEDDDTLIQRVNLPFGLGYCVFADKTARASVKRSFPIGLDVYQQPQQRETTN